MNAPGNTDAALVREARNMASGLRRYNHDAIADLLDRLAAAAERADEAEESACQAINEMNAWHGRTCRAEAALLVAQQERDDLERERLRRQEWNEETLKRAERAEATNTRLRDGITKAQRQFIRGNYTGGRAALADALAQDAEQASA